jgi:fatty acid synthase subunit alpha
MLVRKYIPNLIAKPFDVSHECAQIIYDQTSSPKLDKVLKKWKQEKWASAENRQKLAYIILVELLAYQFASPVRWIQDLLFTTFNFERFVGFSGALGKYSTGLISRLIGGKMPGGFNSSAIKSHLSKNWGLGSSRSDGVLLLGTTLEPPKRLASEAEGKSWLNGVVSVYAQRSGISLASPGTGGASGGGGGAVISSEEFLKFQSDQEKFAAQHVELYMCYLGCDSRTGAREVAFDQERAISLALQAKLDSINNEHGDAYIEGIQPRFDILKARHFDSSWNWVRQDALLMNYDIIFGRLTTVDREITARFLNNPDSNPRSTPRSRRSSSQFLRPQVTGVTAVTSLSLDKIPLLHLKCNEEFLKFQSDQQKFAAQHVELYMCYLGRDSRTGAREVAFDQERATSLALQAKLDSINNEHGDAYIEGIQPRFDILKARHFDSSWNWVRQDALLMYYDIIFGRLTTVDREITARSLNNPDSNPRSTPRSHRSSSQFLRPQVTGVTAVTSLSSDKIPLLHLKRKVGNTWEYSSNLTGVYLDILHEISTSGTTFKDKNALLTGVGKGSIGVEVVKGLLSGGAHVVITTSSYSRKTVEYYQSIFQSFGSRGLALIVVLFNHASKQDVEALVDYICANLGMDYILPFVGIPENGREIDGLDNKSELAHHMMLVNLLRILGAVKNKKASRHFVTRPTQVILPLSPNHGLFGNDGLYSESKICLETLFQRWASESWGEYLCLAGAVIG